MKKLVALLVLALTATVVPAMAATAATTRGSEITVTAKDATVWSGDCDYAPYSIAVHDSWADWEADVTVRKPGGGVVDSDWLYPGSRSGRSFLCSGLDRQGTYRVTVDWTARDENYDVVATETVNTTFKFTVRKKASTRLTVTTNHVRHGFWKMTGRLTQAGKPVAGRRVTVQAKVYGYWSNLKTKKTNRAGVTHWTSRPEPGAGKYPVRLHYAGTDRVQAANSRTFRLYP